MPNRFEPPSESEVGAYLTNLEAKARGRLSPDELGALVAEARDHLEESIQARVELGMSAEEAEREAIATFGAGWRIAHEVSPRAPWLDRRFFFVSLAIVAYCAVFGSGRSFPVWAAVPVVGTALVLHGAFWFLSARARRPQWLAFALILGPLWIGRSVPVGLRDFDEAPRVAARDLAENEAQRQALRRQESSLAQGYARFAQGGEIVSPNHLASYKTDGTIKLYPRPNRAAAEALWRREMEVSPGTLKMCRKSLDEIKAEVCERAQAPRWRFVLGAMGRLFAATGWGPATFYLGSHLYAWFFGFCLRRRRGRRAVGT